MSAPSDAFALTEGERNHPLWKRLCAHLEAELRNQRAKNDGDLDPQDTAKVRGHIRCLKGLIALGAPPLPPQDG
jgi:hypothetical protein